AHINALPPLVLAGVVLSAHALDACRTIRDIESKLTKRARRARRRRSGSRAAPIGMRRAGKAAAARGKRRDKARGEGRVKPRGAIDAWVEDLDEVWRPPSRGRRVSRIGGGCACAGCAGCWPAPSRVTPRRPPSRAKARRAPSRAKAPR